MTSNPTVVPTNPDPAMVTLAHFDRLTSWYAKAARRARISHYLLEVLLLLVGASVSVAALALPGNGVPAAALGSVVVVLTGLRQLFHWNENYLRFIAAGQALEQERRKYDIGQSPYDDPALRDQRLVEVMNGIQSQETEVWMQLQRTRDADRTT
ncbi:MAG: DUF4231 domain-containing protein [Micropruina sp.]|uniref:DUF4231 domain-containing protein n=1 Tax=Micropruina sp. TaxID=2737536 RepID=UPI0039E40433